MIRWMSAWAGILLIALCGCASDRLFNEGRTLIDAGFEAEGIARIEDAIRQDPGNAAYRIFLRTWQDGLIPSLLASADESRFHERFDEAAKVYRRILAIDPRNQPARLGLEKINVMERHQRQIAEAERLFKRNALDRAAVIVHDVLLENPRHGAAQALDTQIAEKRLRESNLETNLAGRFRSPISLEFRDASLQAVFEIISKVAGMNVVYDKEIRPDLRVTIYVKDSSIEDAIRLIAVTNQLGYRVLNENSILLYPNTPQKIKEYQSLVIRSFYLENADAKQVAANLQTLLKTKDIVVNENLNLIILRDTVDAVRLAERIVALEDLNEPEVMLEVEVLEVKRSRLLSLGIKWPDTLTLSTPANMPWSEFTRLTSSQVSSTLNSMSISARQTDSDVKILANPRIRVKNREKAKILIGDRVPVVTTTSTSTGFVADSISYVDVGLKFEADPVIYLDEEVSMKVQLEVSSIVKEVVSRSGTLSYQIGTRNASTILRLKDGETQILAGLINDEDRNSFQKVPGLADFPVLGRLFSQQNDEAQRTEIVLSITPRLVRTIRRPDKLNAEFESGTEAMLESRPFPSARPPAKLSAPAKKAAGKRPALEGVTPPPTSSAVRGKYPVLEGVALNWRGPARVKAGETFNVTLDLSSGIPLSNVAALLEYDAASLKVTQVTGGDFLKKENPDARFSERVIHESGKVFLSMSGLARPVTGEGALVSIAFKAAPTPANAWIHILSITPETANGDNIPVKPVGHLISIE